MLFGAPCLMRRTSQANWKVFACHSATGNVYVSSVVKVGKCNSVMCTQRHWLAAVCHTLVARRGCFCASCQALGVQYAYSQLGEV
jgi:hypothetical protein